VGIAELRFAQVMMKSLDEMLTVVTTAVCASIADIDYASVSVSYGSDDLDTLGATDPRALKADALQYELQEGPCLDALRGLGDTGVVMSRDVTGDERWPRYGSRAAELGIAAQRALRLPTDAISAGLNLYSTSPGELDEQAMALATVFARQAVGVVVLASQVESLAEQLRRRQTISQAIGMVMERRGLDEQGAFQHLVSVSQASQMKVRVLAQDLVDAANSRSSAP
jgi:hypothetical protein